ncbi:UNVERIFIED_CONTAM: hypothetical protein GTU68_054463, partial [Idotea baltica]|nr:hypothetical protein [Idotea baltica]
AADRDRRLRQLREDLAPRRAHDGVARGGEAGATPGLGARRGLGAVHRPSQIYDRVMLAGEERPACPSLRHQRTLLSPWARGGSDQSPRRLLIRTIRVRRYVEEEDDDGKLVEENFPNSPFSPEDRHVTIWVNDGVSGQWQPKDLGRFDDVIWHVSWSITGDILAVSGGDNKVSLWKETLDGQWICLSDSSKTQSSEQRTL